MRLDARSVLAVVRRWAWLGIVMSWWMQALPAESAGPPASGAGDVAAKRPDTSDEADDESAAVVPARGRVVPTPAERDAFDALAGFRAVTIQVCDATGKPLSGAQVRASSEDWGMYWPDRADAVTDASGTLKATIPRGQWSFFVSARPNNDKRGTNTLVAIIALNRSITQNTTVVLRPAASLKLSHTLDGVALPGYARLMLQHPRYAGNIEYLLDFPGVRLPVTIWVDADSTLDAVYLTRGTSDGVVCFGEMRGLRAGERREAIARGQCAAYRMTLATAPFSIAQCEVALARGYTLSPWIANQHRQMTWPVASASTLLVTPGDITLGYSIVTAQHEKVDYLARRYSARAGETRGFELGNVSQVQAFHESRVVGKERAKALDAEIAILDANGHKVERWLTPAVGRTGRVSGVSYRIGLEDRELVRGTLPPNLRLRLDTAVQRPALPNVVYELTVTAGGAARKYTCAGQEEIAVENDVAVIHAPPYMREYAEMIAKMVAAIRPTMLKLVGESTNRPKTHVFYKVFAGLSASVGGNHIQFNTNNLAATGLDQRRIGALSVEFPHNMGFGHSTVERLFLWTPIKAEMLALTSGRLAALVRGHTVQWSVPRLFDYWAGRSPTLEAYTFPSFYLWRKYGFACHRRYIDNITVYRDWLPNVGFSEGESLCAAYSECSGEDLTTIFRLSGWDIGPERVSLARRTLAMAPRPFGEAEDGLVVADAGRLIDGSLDTGPCVTAPPATSSKWGRFGVKFARPMTVRRVVAQLVWDRASDQYAATTCHLERLDGKEWTPIPGTQHEGNPIRVLDITIPAAAMPGIAVRVDRELNSRGKPLDGLYRACCLELEVYDDQGRSLTRPDLSAVKGTAP